MNKKKKKKKVQTKGKKRKGVHACVLSAQRDNKNEFLLSYSQNTAPLDDVQQFRNPKRTFDSIKIAYDEKLWTKHLSLETLE